MNFRLPPIISSNKLVFSFFGALLIVLVFLTRSFSLQVRLISLGALIIGIVALLFAEPVREAILKHLLRDIGIAFIVAVVVTVVYEYSTRNLEEHETMLSVIDKSMAEFVPATVWDEVKHEILQRQTIRRNVDIEFKILRSALLSGNEQITAPNGQVILWMKYDYDLYGMNAGGIEVTVQHELGYEMWNEQLKIPRFESLKLFSHQGRQIRMYVGDNLNRIYKGNGMIRLDGPDRVFLPPPRLNQRVRIVSERYELMGTPGSYNLVMPELTARPDHSQEPTIRVTVSEIPWDLEVSLNTYYAAHTFTQPDKTKNVWFYESIVLPGQGFTLIVKPKFSSTADSTVSKQ